MFSKTWWQNGKKKGKSKAAKSPGQNFRPTLEAFEDRVVPSFTAPISYTVGSAPNGYIPNGAPNNLAAIDLNNNGILDLVEVHNFFNGEDAGDSYVEVLMGNGNGTFKQAVQYNVNAVLQGDILYGDFTNNGIISLILPDQTTVSGATEYGYVEMIGNGDGTFQTPIYSAPGVFDGFAGCGARGWAVGDFTGSGNLDLLANNPEYGITVLPGNGNGTFGAPITTPILQGVASRWVAAGDFTGNGIEDLAIAGGASYNNNLDPSTDQGPASELIILLGNGNGTFRLGGTYAAAISPDPGIDGNGGGDAVNPEDITIAYLTNNGILDVILSQYDHTIDVFMGNGNGTFQPAVAYSTGTTGSYPRDVQVADLTGNGIPDLIIDNLGVGNTGVDFAADGYWNGSIAVMYGNANGTFQAPIEYNSIYAPGWAVVGNFTGDGLPDIAVTGVFDQSTINVMMNQPASDLVTLASPASASDFDTVFGISPAGMTTTLSALGADPNGAANLIYSWSVVSQPSGGNATFSINNSNAAQNSTATLNAFGLYTFEVTITDPVSGDSTTSTVQELAVQDQPPTLGSAAITADPSPVNGTTAVLELPLATEGGANVTSIQGYTGLSYTWTTVGTPPAPVTFTPVPTAPGYAGFVVDYDPTTGNSTVDYETTATFTAAGTYAFQCTISDPNGDSVTTPVINVTVNQTLTSIVVAPNPATVADGTTKPFTATALDQFGNPMGTQPTFTWSTSGLGSVNSSGLYSAPASGTGSATVKAASGSVQGSATVTLTTGADQPPTITSPASAAPDPVTGTSTNLSVAATDPQGLSLSYAWTSTGPAPVTLAAPTAANTLATFAKAGTYTFTVTVTDTDSLQTTSSVSVTVNQALTSIVVTPGTATVADNGTQQFTATALDQFGNALAAQPIFTWSSSGLGSVNSSGLYTAPSSGTGSAAVTAASGGIQGSATVSIASAVSPIVIASTAPLNYNASSLTINVSGVDLNSAHDTVTLSSGSATITSVTANSVTLALTSAPTFGPLTAVITSDGVSSGAPVTVADVGYQDNFTTSGPLGSPWTVFNGALTASNGTVSVATGSAQGWAYLNGASAGNVAESIVVTNLASGASQFVSLMARYQPQNSSWYEAQIRDSSGTITLDIYRIQPNASDLLASTNLSSFASGSVFGFSAVGSSLQVFINGVVALSVTDSVLTGAGSVGFRVGNSSAVQLSSFKADAPPTMVNAASATVGSTTATLSALASDGFGAASLTYTWAVAGVPPAPVTFAAGNGSNAAQNLTATFTKAGTYNFAVAVTDPVGLTTTSTVSVIVNQVLTTLVVTPSTASVADGTTKQFAATALDQFGNPLSAQPTVSWSSSGLGSVNSSGLYTAPSSGTGSATVTAASGGVSGSASVSVVAVPATDTWTGGSATGNWSDPGNWSAGVAPGPVTTVIFNGTSSKNALVDSAFTGTVAAVQISSGYTGTVSLARNLNVTGAFTEQSGTYSAVSFTTTVSGLMTVSGGSYLASTTADNFSGGLTISGGTFTGSTGTVSTANVTLSSGTLNAPAGTLDVLGGNFTYTGGIFNGDEGTVDYSGSGTPTVAGTSARFYNFTDALAAYPSTLTISGTLTATGTFSVLGNSVCIYGNIEAQGNVNDENHGGIGNPYLTLDGSANQTIEDLSGEGGGQFRTITINKTGGTVALACNPVVFSGLTLSAGTVNTGSYAWVVGSPISAAAGLNLGNIEIDGSVVVGSTSLQVANVTFLAAGDSLKAPTGNLLVSGNWNDSAGGTFTANGGTVVFNGSSGTQLIYGGGQSFNNLTIAVGATLELESNVTVLGTFTNSGTLNLNGFQIIT
jgi:FG-GAP-like repeat